MAAVMDHLKTRPVAGRRIVPRKRIVNLLAFALPVLAAAVVSLAIYIPVRYVQPTPSPTATPELTWSVTSTPGIQTIFITNTVVVTETIIITQSCPVTRTVFIPVTVTPLPTRTPIPEPTVVVGCPLEIYQCNCREPSEGRELWRECDLCLRCKP